MGRAVNSSTPISVASEAWITARSATNKIKSEGTRLTYRKHIRAAIRCNGDIPVGDWSRDETDRYAGSLLHLHPNTRHAKLNTIKVFFDWLVRTSVIESHPFAHIEAISKVDADHHRPVRLDVLEATLAVCRPKAKLMILLGAHIGLRRMEIAKLRRSDFDTHERTVRILGKGTKRATLPITDAIVDALDVVVANYSIPPTGYLFPSTHRRGEPVRPLSVYTRITDAFWRATGEHVTPHQLRSFAATTVARQHGILTAQLLMRHASATTTAGYVDLGYEDIRAQIDSTFG